MSFASPRTAGRRAAEPYPFLFAGAASDPAALLVARKAGRAPVIDDIRACSARPQWHPVRRSNRKKRGRRLNSGVSETGRCRLGGTRVPVGVEGGDGRVSDGDERRGWMRNLLLLMMVVGC